MTARPFLADCRVVSFDACDTLIVSDPPVAQVIHDACLDLGFAVDRDTVEAVERDASGAVTEAVVRAHLAGEARPAATNFDLWKRAFCSDPRWPSLDEADFRALERKLSEVMFGMKPLPDAESVLDGLRDSGRGLCVTSNFDQTLEDMLREVGLRRYFDTVLASEVVGFEKPDRRIFEEALKRAGVSAREMVHVGDHPFDVLGARAAGIRCVWLRGPAAFALEDMPAPDATITRLTELLPLMGLAGSGASAARG